MGFIACAQLRDDENGYTVEYRDKNGKLVCIEDVYITNRADLGHHFRSQIDELRFIADSILN